MDSLCSVCDIRRRVVLDILQMKVALFAILALISCNTFAASTVVYPGFNKISTGTYFNPGQTSSTFGTTFKVPPTETLSNNWGVKSGWFWQSADTGSLAATSRMSTSDAQAMNRAITGASKASQPAAKLLASNIIKLSAGGVLATIALDMGLEYLNGQWNTLVPSDTTTGTGCSVRTGLPWLNTLPANYQGSWTDTYNGTCVCATVGLGYWPCPTASTGAYTAATDTTWTNVPTRDLTDNELAEMVRLGYAVPVDKPAATVIGDFTAMTAADLAILASMGYFQQAPVTVKSGAPYTDPITGQKMQPQLSISPEPNGGARVTSTDQPINEDGTSATEPDGTPLKPEDAIDPCTSNPNSLACTSLGSLDTSADPVAHTFDVSLTPGTLNTSGTCPADRSLTLMGNSVVMSFQPICNAASTYVRPFVLLASAVVASFIFVSGLKT